MVRRTPKTLVELGALEGRAGRGGRAEDRGTRTRGGERTRRRGWEGVGVIQMLGRGAGGGAETL